MSILPVKPERRCGELVFFWPPDGLYAVVSLCRLGTAGLRGPLLRRGLLAPRCAGPALRPAAASIPGGDILRWPTSRAAQYYICTTRINRKAMSKTLLVILIILAPIVASSQCVFRVDGKDPITNQEVKRHDFYLSGSFEVTLSRKHDTYEFIVDFELDGEQNYSIPPGTKTIIKLINGDVIEVLSNN